MKNLSVFLFIVLASKGYSGNDDLTVSENNKKNIEASRSVVYEALKNDISKIEKKKYGLLGSFKSTVIHVTSRLFNNKVYNQGAFPSRILPTVLSQDNSLVQIPLADYGRISCNFKRTDPVCVFPLISSSKENVENMNKEDFQNILKTFFSHKKVKNLKENHKIVKIILPTNVMSFTLGYGHAMYSQILIDFMNEGIGVSLVDTMVDANYWKAEKEFVTTFVEKSFENYLGYSIASSLTNLKIQFPGTTDCARYVLFFTLFELFNTSGHRVDVIGPNEVSKYLNRIEGMR